MSFQAAIARRGAALVKRADDSDGQDSSFETAMSNLAHITLRDKAPGLLDYEVGFQLVDRNDDSTRAVAVMAFKIGSQWVYAPIFFLDGKMKADMLYLKSQDIFCPLKENWVDYVLRKKPDVLGESTPRATGNLGVLPPDLQQIIRSPYKYASAGPHWLEDVLPALARAVVKDPRDRIQTLPDFMKLAGMPAVRALAHMVKSFPRLAAYCDQLHGSDLANAIKEAAKTPPPPAPEKAPADLLEGMRPELGSLRTVKYDLADGSDLPLLFSDKDKERVVDNSTEILDDRPDGQVSIPYTINVRQQLQTPTESGLYDVLVRPMSYQKCYVAMGPRSTGGRGVYCTVVRLDAPQDFKNIHPSYVWVGQKYGDKEWSQWFKGLPDATNLTEEDADDPDAFYDSPLYMLVGPNGESTVPFRVRKSLGGEGDYVVDFQNWGSPDVPAYIAKLPRQNWFGGNNFGDYGDPVIHLNGGRGSKIWSAQNDLYIPNGWKKLVVRNPKESGRETLELGTSPEVHLDLVRKTAALRIVNDGAMVRIDDHRKARLQQKVLTTKEAVLHLVCDHGLRENTARELLKRAAEAKKQGHDYFECRVKYASPYLTDTQPSSPPFLDPPMGSQPLLQGSIPSTEPFYQNSVATDLLPPPDAAYQYDPRMTYQDPQPDRPPTPDPSAVQTAQQAAQSGQKQVFDTSVINSLLKSTQPDMQVDRFIAPLTKGMDAYGRILISYYWHPDDFAERYGKDDMAELEDMLRNSFNNSGDVILKLKQKAIDADPIEAAREIDMTSLSDS